jgi:phosphate transport system protein
VHSLHIWVNELFEIMIIRRNFEEQLSELQEDLMRLGRFVQEAHGKAIDSLMRGDLPLAKQIINDDDFADDMTFGIQARATQLLALQQPMARDLRFVASVLKIVTDLERIGDHASDIAKVTRTMAGQSYLRPPVDLNQLSQLACEMIGNALQAFVQHDTELAIQVARDDDAVDDLCDEVQRDMMNLMRADSSRVEQATRLLLVARSLERSADHATNIAEQVYYVETGQMRPLAREEHNHALLTSLGVDESDMKRINSSHDGDQVSEKPEEV